MRRWVAKQDELLTDHSFLFLLSLTFKYSFTIDIHLSHWTLFIFYILESNHIFLNAEEWTEQKPKTFYIKLIDVGHLIKTKREYSL